MMNRILVCLIGDSLTQQSFCPLHFGWGASLADWYSRTGSVVNCGYSGYNSRWILDKFKDILHEDRGGGVPATIFDKKSVESDRYLVTLFLGANDCSDDIEISHKDNRTGQFVSLAEFEANMKSLIERVKGEVDRVKKGQMKYLLCLSFASFSHITQCILPFSRTFSVLQYNIDNASPR